MVKEIKMEKVENLKTLKQDYEKIKQKYNLPEWKYMNEEFGIEDIQQLQLENMVGHVRQRVMGRIYSILNWLEGFMNPQRANMANMMILNDLTEDDKKLLNKVYANFIKITSKFTTLGTIKYNEKAEAEFMKEAIKKFEDNRNNVRKFAERIEYLHIEKLK